LKKSSAKEKKNMSEKNQPETFQEPKLVNTVALINQRNHIKTLIDNRYHKQALEEMGTLVCEFELTPKDKEMEKIQEELIGNYCNPNTKGIPPFQDIIYFLAINDYMNKTYLRGFKVPIDEGTFKDLEGEDNPDKETES
jgi:hypothetical protein